MAKFTIVSGEPRSGTSMMMQTLNLLGVPVWKNDELQNISKDIDQIKHVQKLNPKGFFETGFVVRGINVERIKKNKDKPDFDKILESHNGETIKIITRGLLHTDLELIDKIIFCARSPRAIAYSQTELITSVMIASDKGNWKFPQLKFNSLNYIINISRLLKNIDKFKDKMLIVQYDDMLNKTKESIMSIISFLNLTPNEDQIYLTIKNIDPSLNRKSNPPSIPGKEWEIAEELYRNLIKKETVETSTENSIKDYLRDTSKKNANWLEESIWANCDISLYEKIQTDEKTKKILMNNAEKRRIRGMICVSCEHYNRNGSSYIVERDKIENLIRNKVDCEFLKKEVTLEQCQNHWRKLRGLS